MRKTPLIVYLDTQDYIRLFNEPEESLCHSTLNELLTLRDRGHIIIRYSWAIMLEFITRPTERHRTERVRRGELVKKICGQNSFPFFTNVESGEPFPNDNLWSSKSGSKLVTAKWLRRQMEKEYLATLAQQDGLNRNQRRKLKTRSGMYQLFRESTSDWGTKREHFQGLPVSDEFIESGVFSKFLKGRCSDAEIEQRMNLWLSDPAEYSRIVYDYADKPNLIDDFLGNTLNKMEESWEDIQNHFNQLDKISKEIQVTKKSLADMGFDNRSVRNLIPKVPKPKFDTSDLIDRVEQHVGKGRAEHIAHYFHKSFRKDYNFKRSDFMDLMQMFYVPYCDLFRCDKAMASMFSDFEPFKDKLVSRFNDLPSRIEEIQTEIK